MEKDLQKQGTKELVDTSMFEGQVSGFEKTDSSTFKTPFLKVLQALSPELDSNDSKFIEGARQGHLCNSATQEVYDSIKVVVLKVESSLITWRPDRGGFVSRHNKSEEDKIVARREGMEKWDSEGNEIMDTVEFFCMNAESPSDIFIFPLSGASIKHARSFATRLRMLKYDGKLVNASWAGVWTIKTIKESNDKGSWYTIGNTPDFERWITREERDNFVLPAMEILNTAETDYTTIESGSKEKEEDVEF